jgi:hypothetical protein
VEIASGVIGIGSGELSGALRSQVLDALKSKEVPLAIVAFAGVSSYFARDFR